MLPLSQTQPAAPARLPASDVRRHYVRWAVAAVALCVAFAQPLWRLAAFSTRHEAYSHLMLIPVIAGYMVWIRRRELPAPNGLALLPALLAGAAGAGMLGTYLVGYAGVAMPTEDALAFTTSAFLFFLVGITVLLLGTKVLQAVAFPAGFLVFMIPMPADLTARIDTFLQHGSALVAVALFETAGTPLVRHDVVFQLPGIVFQIAPECSGIRSTLALLITSVLAGFVFLRAPWRRALLVAIVIPLALLRNGFRVFTIGELCVHISPDMIDSYIHHHGGPIFFALSLIPFVLALRYLAAAERTPAPAA